MTAEHAERFGHPDDTRLPQPVDAGPADRPRSKSVEQLRYDQEMRTFAQVSFTVQGLDELTCLEAIEARLREFSGDRWTDWTVVSCHYMQQEIGDPPTKIWNAEVACVRNLGSVPWA